MKPLPKGYLPSHDGRYRRRVEFDVQGKPNLISIRYLVRTRDGDLLKTEYGGTETKPLDAVKPD